MNLLKIGVYISIMALIPNVNASEVLRIAFPVKQLQLDPQKIEDQYSTTIVNQLYSRLFKYTPDGQIRPELVESWTISKDKTIYTFNLKKMSFSDGTPITARHVENSIKRIFVLNAALASDLAVIKGSKQFMKSRKPDVLMITAKNDHTLVIETGKPTSLLSYLLAVPDVGILKLDSPTQTIEFSKALPFSGPFKIDSVTNETTILRKWRSSDFDSQRPPKQIEFNLFETLDFNKVAPLKITDTSSFITFDQEKSPFEGNSGWHQVASEASNERFIVMNPDKVPTDVRLWMASKVNSEDFVKFIGDKSIVPAFGFIPNCLPGHLKKGIKRPSSELKLKRTLTMKVIHGSNLPYAEKFKSYITKVWSHPHLKFEFESLPISEYLEKLFNKKGEVIIGARGLEYPEGFSIVTYFRSNLDSNYFYVKNKKIDQLIDKASQEIDDEKRFKIYEEIQEKALDAATVIPLAFGSWKKYYWSNRIKDVPAHPIGIHFMPLEMLTMAEN